MTTSNLLDGADAVDAATPGLVRQVELRNFGSHAQTTIVFDRPIVFVVGENNAGKSTIPEAIEWCLTGRNARGVDGGGRGADALITDGAGRMGVTVEIGGVTVRREYAAGGRGSLFSVNGAATADQQGLLYEHLGTTPGFLHAVFNAYAFLDQDHTAAKAFLMDVLDVRVDVDGASLSLAQLQTAYKTAYDARTAKRADLKAHHVPTKPSGEPIDVDTVTFLEEQLRALRDTERALLQDGAEARGRRQALDQQIATLTRDRDMLKARVNSYGDLHGAIDEKTNAREALIAPEVEPVVVPEAETREIANLQDKLVDARGQLRMLETSRQAIEGRNPDRGCVLDAEIPCRTEAKEFLSRAKYIPKAIKSIERNIDAFIKRLNILEAEARGRSEQEYELRRQRDAVLAQRDALASDVRQLEAKLFNQEQDQERLTQVLADLARVETELKNLGDVADPPELAALQERIAKGEQTIADARTEAQAWARYTTAAAKAKTLTKEVADLEAKVERLGPKGDQLKAIEAALGRFLDQVNGALARFGYALAIELDPWRILVNGRPAARLSTSERLRVGLCLQLAIADLIGLRLVVFDNTEWLVGSQVREALTDLVFDWALAQPGRQLLVLKATTDRYPAIPHAAVYRVTSTNGVSAVARES